MDPLRTLALGRERVHAHVQGGGSVTSRTAQYSHLSWALSSLRDTIRGERCPLDLGRVTRPGTPLRNSWAAEGSPGDQDYLVSHF